MVDVHQSVQRMSKVNNLYQLDVLPQLKKDMFVLPVKSHSPLQVIFQGTRGRILEKEHLHAPGQVNFYCS